MDVTKSIVPKAAKRFLKGEYGEALKLYEKAAEAYGGRLFEANITLCKRGLFESERKVSLVVAKSDFLASHEDVYKKTESKASKYLKVAELNSKIGKQPRAKEILFLIEYATALRNVQMSETYIGIVRFLVKNALKIEPGLHNEFLRHVRNAFLISGDESILIELKRMDESFIKRITLPSSIISSLDKGLVGLLRAGTTIGDLSYDCQEDKDKILSLHSHEGFSSALAEQKRGLMLNYYSLVKDDYAYKVELNKLFAENGLSGVELLNFCSDNFLSTVKAFDQPYPLRLSKKSPLVTVIMSCFNSEKTVSYALNSLLKQTYNNLEVLVCDDCSDDSSLLEIQRLANQDSRVKVFKSNDNQGTYNIRNALLERAQGEYITFHDADDWAHPQKLELQVKFIQDEGVPVCSARWIRVDPTGKTIFFVDGRIFRFCVVSTMVDRRVFNIIPKFRKSLVAADTEFHESCVQLLGSDQVKVLDKPLVLGLWGDGSLTKREGLKAENNGHVASRRRAYSDIAARQRVLGSKIVPDEVIEKIMKENGIYREYQGVSRIGGSE